MDDGNPDALLAVRMNVIVRKRVQVTVVERMMVMTVVVKMRDRAALTVVMVTVLMTSKANELTEGMGLLIVMVTAMVRVM